METLQPHKVSAEPATYKGESGLRVTDGVLDGRGGNEDHLVVLEGSDFGDGTIEIELSAEPGFGTSGLACGFIGVAFRVVSDV